MKNSIQVIVAWVIQIHALLFLVFWQTNGLFFYETNDYLVKKTGLKMDFIGIFLVFAGILLILSIVQILSFSFGWNYLLKIPLFWLYAVLSVLFIGIFYGGFWLLFQESPVQWIRIGQLIGYFRVFIDPILFVGIVTLIGFGMRALRMQDGAVPLAILIAGIAALVLLWIVPLILPPSSVYRGALPAKPKIIAHRGASMLAPENTISSARLAAELGVYGLETDLHLTRDGALVLMHDDTLKRTTDVDRLFPGREKERVENFSLAEIQQLNAGAWFLNVDPFQSVSKGLVTPAQSSIYQSEKVPLLADELAVVQQNHLILIFDLKQPPDGHPFAQTFFDTCLKQLQLAHIDSQIWFLANTTQVARIRAESPQMIPAIGLDDGNPVPAETIKMQGYQLVNAEYGLTPEWIRAYQDATLWVNLYTVDESWQFSRLWLMGVDSITTSNAGVLAVMRQPILAVPNFTYLLIWIAIGILGILIELLIALGR